MALNKCLAFFVLVCFLVLSRAHAEENVEDPPTTLYSTEEEFDSERVAGGVATTIEKFPYQVLVSVANQTVCGGFIISKTWVMTAAHCVDGAFPETVMVRAGTSNLQADGVVIAASQYVLHSSYNATISNDYDFALIQINGTFNFSSAIKAIAIPPQNRRLPVLGTVTVVGWGSTTEGSAFSPTLRSVSVSLVPSRLCRIIYRGTAAVTDRMFCAGRLIFGGRGACQGDIGGAAIYNNQAVGIASFGVTCGGPIFPSVFANVASVSEWVKGVTGISSTILI